MDGEIDYVQLGITFSHHYGYRRDACRAAGALPMNEGSEAASLPSDCVGVSIWIGKLRWSCRDLVTVHWSSTGPYLPFNCRAVLIVSGLVQSMSGFCFFWFGSYPLVRVLTYPVGSSLV